MKVNRMLHASKQEWLRRIQSWLTTSAYALAVAYFCLRLLNILPVPMDQLVLPFLGLTLLCFVGISFWRVTLPLILLLTGIVGAQFFLHSPFEIPVIGLAWWENVISVVSGVFRWVIQLPNHISTLPNGFYAIFCILLSLLSVLTHWVLPIPILNMIFLIGPLFFLSNLTVDPLWLFWLVVGLFGVYASYAYRQDPDRQEQRPPLFFGALVILFTLGLQMVIPPQWFYHEPLADRMKDLFPEAPASEIQSFSLGELGFYPQGNLRVGGTVTPSEDVYLHFTGGADSFYLRGASYDAFDGNRWSLADAQQLSDFVFHENFYDDFSSPESQIFWFRSADVRDEAFQKNLVRPDVYHIRTEKPTRIVFHGGRPMAITALKSNVPSHTATDEVATKYGANTDFYFTYSGMVAAEKSYEDYGLVTVDYVTPVANLWNPGIMGNIQVPQGPGERKYETIVRQRDPELAKILYDQKGDFATLYPQMRAHFDANYTYSLNVPDISDDEDFIDYFLTNRQGYCVYFATSYAVLLRDIGYPTRYAEGFVVPQGTGDPRMLTERTLSGKQAHAWTEIYLDGFGWLPLEATPTNHISALSGLDPNEAQNALPPYQMPETLFLPQESSEASESVSDESSIDAQESSSQKESSESKQDFPPKKDAFESNRTKVSNLFHRMGRVGGFVLIGAVLVLFVALLWMVARYQAWKARLKATSWKKAGRTDSDRFEVLWGHILRLLRLNGWQMAPNTTIPELIADLCERIDLDAKTAGESNSIEEAQEAVTEARRRIESIRYGEASVSASDLEMLFAWYGALTMRYKESVNRWTWFWNDVLRVSGRPW